MDTVKCPNLERNGHHSYYTQSKWKPEDYYCYTKASTWAQKEIERHVQELAHGGVVAVDENFLKWCQT